MRTKLEFQHLFASQPLGVQLLAADGSLIETNPAGLRIFEADAFPQIEKQCVHAFVAPEHRAAFRELTENIFRGESGQVEFQFTGLKGGCRWLEMHASPLRDASGTVTALLGITHDVTQRKDMELALTLHEREFRTVVENTPDSIVRYDLAGRRIYFNPAFLKGARLGGRTGDELLGRTPVECYIGTPEVGQQSLAVIQQVIREQRPAEFEMAVPDVSGNLHHCECHFIPEFDPAGQVLSVLHIVRDITERKRMEDALAAREHEFRALVENAPDPIVRYDREYRRLYVNPALVRISGVSADRLLGTTPTANPLVPSGQPEKIIAGIRHVLETGEPFVNEVEFIAPDGSHDSFLNRYVPERNRDGAVVSVLSISADITGRKQVENALRKLSRAVEQSPVSIVITDAQGHIEYVNSKFTETTGYTLDEVLGRNPSILKSGEQPAEVYEKLWQTISAGHEWRGEFHNRKKNGELFWESAFISPIQDAAGTITHYLAFKEDITEHRRLEDQLRQSQKMDAIGQLAGGVAHDFNNILTVMMMQTEMARTVKGTPEPVQEGLEQIAEAATRAADLTRQLLLFSRKQVMHTRELDLNDVVTSLAKMLQRIIGEDVQLQLHLHPNPLITRADAGMLDQVLMNLAVNARDAMPKGGRLLIETTEAFVDAAAARLNSEAAPGRYICARVSDTGGGIPPEVLPRIFEPFFTTKDPGKGTGLGLATVFGIVKQHRGWLTVDSKPGQGTQFQIFLPAFEPAPGTNSAARTRQPIRGGTETILVVEDELGVRSLMRHVLERHGYKVREAANGVEALKVWQAHRDSVALLLTDMVMPAGLSGREVAQRLQADQPGLKVVFTSGYSAEIAGKELELRSGENFVQKPFSQEVLLKTVRRCLDS